jgi:hypothetical protein
MWTTKTLSIAKKCLHAIIRQLNYSLIDYDDKEKLQL